MNNPQIIIKDKGWYEEQIEGNIGSLMFPNRFREFTEYDKKSYSMFRKKHNIKGRIKMFIETNPRVWEKNKEIKYKYPMFCEEEHCDEVVVFRGQRHGTTSYPFGDIYVIN